MERKNVTISFFGAEGCTYYFKCDVVKQDSQCNRFECYCDLTHASIAKFFMASKPYFIDKTRNAILFYVGYDEVQSMCFHGEEA